jgi:hypothetical protein
MTVTIAWNPLGSYLFDSLPKGQTSNAERYRDNILSALLSLRLLVDGNKIMIHADNGSRTHLANAELFVPKIPYDSAHTHRIPLTSHHMTSFFSGMLRTACSERVFDHAKNHLRQLVRLMAAIPPENLYIVFEH